MKNMARLAACLIAAFVIVTVVAFPAMAACKKGHTCPEPTAADIIRAVGEINTSVAALGARVDTLDKRVGCAESGCGRPLAAAPAPTRTDPAGPTRNRHSYSDEAAIFAAIRGFCADVATAGYGQAEFEDWVVRLEQYRKEGYYVDSDCVSKAQERIREYKYPPPPPPAAITDPVRPRATIGVMAVNAAPVGFPIGLGFGSRSLEARVLVGISTDNAKPLYGADLALFPKLLQGKAAQLGVAFRGAMITETYDQSSVTIITGGPRLRLYDTTPCSSGGYVEFSGLLGSVIKDRDPGKEKNAGAEFTGGGAIDLGWAF